MRYQTARARSFVAAAGALVATTVLSGCSNVATVPVAERPEPVVSQATIPATTQAQIDSLLAKADLHASEMTPTTSVETLDDSAPGATQYVDVSNDLGLDLESQMGEAVRWYSVVLKERGRSQAGTVTANFAVVDGKVVGAGIYIANYWPGVFALDDRSEIASSLAE